MHVVDDDLAVRDSTSFFLRIAGFRPFAWEAGDRFLAEADLEGPGCVLLDVRMPGPDGMSVLRELARRGSGLRAIVMTGHGDVATAADAIREGAAEFIEKPYDEAELVEMIRRVSAAAHPIRHGGADAGTAAEAATGEGWFRSEPSSEDRD